MKTTRLRYFFYLLLLASWLLPASCSSEDEATPELAVLNLGVSADGLSSLTYGIPGIGDENTVERMRVLIFNSQTLTLEENNYYGTVSNPMPTLPTSLSYTLRMGPKRILILGNEPTALSPTLNGLTRFSDLQALTMSNELTINTLPLCLPFSTTRELNVSPSALPTGRTSIVLERGVGKIQVQIARDSANLKTVDLQGVQLINVPTISTLIDGYPQASPTLTDLPQDPHTLANMGLTYQPLTINSPYIYENFPLTSASQTLLRVFLTQNTVAMTADVPLVCGTDASGQYIFGVRRNTVSNMRLTVLGDHLKIEYVLSPWDDENPWDKEAGVDDSNILFLPWDDEPGYDWDIPHP